MLISKNITFVTFNLYNLQLPDKPWRQGKKYTEKQYRAKVAWSAERLKGLDADIIAFQELWSKQCLIDVFAEAGLANDYKLAFIGDGWYDIAIAAAVRKPWQITSKKVRKKFPPGFILKKRKRGGSQDGDRKDDDVSVKIDRFSRSVLVLGIKHGTENKLPAMKVFTVHFKSKLGADLDKQENDKPSIKRHSKALGAALSTIRRTSEAAALRIILNDAMKETKTPVVVLGDFNDDCHSNTLAIITGQPPFRLFEASRKAGSSDQGLYSAGFLQQYRSLRDVYYTHEHQEVLGTLDHVLVSEQFYDHSKNRIWTFEKMRIWNDHIEDDQPATSDHGLVRAAFRYKPAKR